MKDKKIASIIVLNYFGEKLIQKTVESLINLDYPQNNLEIIIVDNNSQDKSREIINKLARSHRNIVPLFASKNLGFAAGNNLGINQAKGDYIVLLNNDCIVTKSWLKELIKTARKSKDIFAVNSKIMLGKSNKIQNAGIMIFQDGYGRDIGAIVQNHQQDYEADQGQYDNEKEVYAACGAAVLYKKSILDKIGNLDETFFMYYEDVEICERARLHGYKTFYCPKAIVYHEHAASSHEGSSFFLYNVEKNRLLHLLYHFPFHIFLRELIDFIITAKLRMIKSVLKKSRQKESWQYIKAGRHILFHLPKYLIKRSQLHKNVQKGAITKNYQKIISGDWYFK